VYCPQCLAEYRDGFTECSDCRVALVAGVPPLTGPEFDPNIDLVVVFESNDAVENAMAKGALEAVGIPFFALGQIATLVQDVDPLLRKLIRIQVVADREQEALEVLELLEMPAPLAEGADVE
jgi:hypothetical protein